MRIVIDLLGSQISIKRNQTNLFLQDILKWLDDNRVTEYFFIIHSNNKETEKRIRKEIYNTPKIVKFIYFSSDTYTNVMKINREIYLSLIKSLKPDAVIVDENIKKHNLNKFIIENKEINKILFTQSNLPDLTKKKEPDSYSYEESVRKPRLLIVSPLPPEKTGIAFYNLELSRKLSEYYQICFITDQKNIPDEFAVKTTTWFLENISTSDRVLYHIGNSSYHAEMFELIKIVPGVMVLHDFFLGDVIWYNEVNNLSPNALSRALYSSHGYSAVKERFSSTEPLSSIKKYPANFDLLNSSIGIVFHSKYALQLLQHWYPGHKLPVVKIPHLREVKTPDKKSSLSKLGFSNDSFIVASFGFLGSSKCNIELLQAWQQSCLAKNTNAYLVFVGDGCNDAYHNQLQEFIHQHRLTRVKITGFVNQEIYEHYLSAADFAVQLRTFSRGETSGTVLDCMAYALPVIINQNGSMAEIDPSATLQLTDKFCVAELTEALNTLYKNNTMRSCIGSNAQICIESAHSPELCALRYAEAIESFYKNKNILDLEFYSSLTSSVQSLSDTDLIQLANTIAQNFPKKKAQKTLFIDVSVIARDDFKTGIQRVVRALTLELLNNPPEGFRIEPIYLSEVDGTWSYFNAHSYSSYLLDMSDDWLLDQPTEFNNDDIFLGLDLAGSYVIKAAEQGLYEHLKDLGVYTAFVVYDLIPILFEQFYSSGAGADHAQWLRTVCQADKVICISQAVSQELHDWLQVNEPERLTALNIQHFHLGADINSSSPSEGLPDKGVKLLKQLKAHPSFLMVGTVEPRKGHWQTLKAFECLWAQNHNARLVIVGKAGWLIDDLANELKQHPELNRRLFWFADISDEYLTALYDACACLIAASYCEGFGLPLIEAAKQQLPIIARDLPVFREVAQQHAFYFDSHTAEKLAETLVKWMSLYKADKHPKSLDMPLLTWQASAQQLLSALTADKSENITPRSMMNQSHQKPAKRLLIDLSATCRHDLKTGIERVARALLLAFIENPPEGYNVVPIYLSDLGHVWHYRYAYTYLANIQNQICLQEDCMVEPCAGDIVLGLDISGEMLIQAAASGLFKRYKAAGVSTYFMVHDLLPISMPEVFPLNANLGHERWLKTVITMDGAVCVSKTVASELQDWFTHQPKTLKNPAFSIKWSHHGADVVNSSPSTGLPEDADLVLEQLKQRPSFVMVGTIEPRKGYLQTVQAFDLLWKQGVDVNLVIVGYEGWKGLDDNLRGDIPETAQYLRSHPELNKHLFWLEGVSDEFLEKVYAVGSCLIAASYGEGFGLPLIEAAQKNIPIVARDIPVFREVAGEYAHYFTANHPEKLANVILDWLKLYEQNQHPSSERMPWLTWQQSAQSLHKYLLECAN